MSQITLDKDLRAKLNELNEHIEFRDDAGNVVGHFLPPALFRELLLAWADVHFPVEEMERRRQEPGGRTLAEIWKSLGKA